MKELKQCMSLLILLVGLSFCLFYEKQIVCQKYFKFVRLPLVVKNVFYLYVHENKMSDACNEKNKKKQKAVNS